jgi:uncharacterized protein DUF3618
MGQEPSPVGPRGTVVSGQASPNDPAQVRADIERTREELGDTVAALTEKTDVKGRAKGKVAEVRQNVTDKGSGLADKARDASPDSAGSAVDQLRAKAKANPVPTAALAALVGGVLVGRMTKRS